MTGLHADAIETSQQKLVIHLNSVDDMIARAPDKFRGIGNNLLPLAETWGTDANLPPPTNALARFGTPEEDITPVVLFLASKDAQFLTGYSLTPDGGSIIDSAR